MLRLERIEPADIAAFRRLVERYWQELLPHAPVIHAAARRAAYFRECFAWEGGNRHPCWAVVDDRSVGFVLLELDEAKQLACITDLYVLPAARRKGYGSALVQAVYSYLDERGMELIELDVRRDNPEALAFWQARGFRIALYCLRQYRDPQTGTAFIGALSSDFA